MKHLKIFFNILTTIFFALVIAETVLIIIPKFMGYEVFAVSSKSMEKEILFGSLVITKKIDSFDLIKENDIITFTNKEKSDYFTHRVIKLDEKNDIIYTKGDNNDYIDPSPTNFQYVSGKVEWIIPFLGYVKLFFSSIYSLIISAVIILIYIIFNVIFTIKKQKDNEKEINL
ncbi:MAG: signal peptidase I [Clostridia bacterium]